LKKRTKKLFSMALADAPFMQLAAATIERRRVHYPTANPLESKVFCFFFSKKKRLPSE
jgi:hypothetical protein